MSIIDHVSIGTNDFKAAVKFYDAGMATLGYARVAYYEEYKAAAYGEKGSGIKFWVGGAHNGNPATPGNGVHFGFKAPSRDAVHAFHETALKAGGKCDGEPGPRPHYSENYYGCFVLDPDGNKIEAVCFSEK